MSDDDLRRWSTLEADLRNKASFLGDHTLTEAANAIAEMLAELRKIKLVQSLPG